MVANKIGRNDPCPCRSGKKYKHCHLNDTGSLMDMPIPIHYGHSLVKEFSKYEKVELVRKLAALMLVRENHSQNYRIEFAIQAALASNPDKSSKPIVNLHGILKDYLPSDGPIGSLEDATENLFTENIEFTGGNYIVYPGINTDCVEILRSFLAGVFLIPNKLPDQLKKEVFQGAILMLVLSDRIAKKAHHSRYESSNSEHRTSIVVPSSRDISTLENAVEFPMSEVLSIIQRYKISSTVFDKFCTQLTSGHLSDLSVDTNPLLLSPLVVFQDTLIVVAPNSILKAVNHYIISSAIENDCIAELIFQYAEASWSRVGRCLYAMNYEPIEFPSTMEKLDSIRDILCKFDGDKIAYVQLIFDNASSYSSNFIDFNDEAARISRVARDRKAHVLKSLESNNKYSDYRIFYMVLHTGIGRTGVFDIDRLLGKNRSLSISLSDLDTLIDLRECDSLTLWKYSDAITKFHKQTRVITTSFLNEFSLYLDHDHSFYLNDDPKPSTLYLNNGGTKKLRTLALRSVDKHAEQYEENRTSTVRRKWKDDSFPIYYIDGVPNRYAEFLVKGYYQPIWCKVGIDLTEVDSSLRSFYFEMNETLAYWLWQLTPSLKPLLKSMGDKPINVLFDFENPEKWQLLEDSVIKDPEVGNAFKGEFLNDRTIKIIIPDRIQPYLRSSDNDGERKILDFLLYLFAKISEAQTKTISFNEKIIEQILETHVPKGMKKKIFIYHSKNNIIADPSHLDSPRWIPEHDLEEQFDLIVDHLGNKCPTVGEIISDKLKEQLGDDIVAVFYTKLSRFLNEFRWQEILPMLVMNYEALLYEKHIWTLQSPTRIACFTGFEKHLDELFEQSKEVENASVITRVLIELVAAIQPTGTKIMNLDDLDKMMAMASQIITWANIRNSIKFKLEDVKMGILPSKRIGTSKNYQNEVQNPFFREKTRENIELSVENFEENFQEEETPQTGSKEQKITTEDLNNAFIEEFGVLLTELESIFIELANSLHVLGTSTPYLSESALINYLESRTKLNKEVLLRGIKYLSSEKRSDYLIPPAGYLKIDIFPWINNRRLSYFRKPLIKVLTKNEPIYYWGPRHCYNSMHYLFNNINDGRLNVVSPKMLKCMKTIQGYIGKPFTNAVFKWIRANTSEEYKCYKEVEKPLKPFGLKGDIDVLLIAPSQKCIFLLECKNIKYARNAMEMYHEILDFVGKKNDPSSWISKHHERELWVKANRSVLTDVFKIDLSEFDVKSYMVTPSDIPITYLRSVKLDVPVISFMKLKREGIGLINN